MRIIKQHYRHILFFGIYLIVLLVCMSPDVTLMCYGSDGYSIFYGDHFLERRYPSPVHAFLGYPVSHIPFGNAAGNVVLFLSVLPAFACSILVFAILKKKTENPLSPWVGAATVMGSYIFFSQSIIIEVYVLLAVFLIASYALIVYDKPRLAAIACGIAMGVHLTTSLIFFFAMIMYFKQFRRSLYVSVIVAAAIIFLYYGLLPRFYWDTGNINSFPDFVRAGWAALGSGGEVSEIFGGILTAIKVLCIGFGLSLVPIILSVKRIRESAPLLFLLVIPILFVVVGNFPYRFSQIVPFVPFAGVLAGIGMEYVRTSYLGRVILVFVIAMMVSTPFFFDVGKTIDESPTTARQLYNLLGEVEDGSLIMCLKMFEAENGLVSDTDGNHVAVIVEHYNSDFGTNLVPVPLDFAWDKNSTNVENLAGRGISVPEFDDRTFSASEEDAYLYVMNAICDVNPERDAYWYRIVDKETIRCELVSLK